MLRFNQLLIAISLYHFLLLTKTHILKLYSDFSLTASWDWLILSKWNYQPWIQTQISPLHVSCQNYYKPRHQGTNLVTQMTFCKHFINSGRRKVADLDNPRWKGGFCPDSMPTNISGRRTKSPLILVKHSQPVIQSLGEPCKYYVI